jgi:N-ethylmaleimide reductase
MNLFTPIQVGAIHLKNRMVMAPMTRSRANPDRAPNVLMAEYYAQRVSAGLIIAEATQISPQAAGAINTPGIHTEQHIKGWQLVTDAVHAKGGKIFLQLWHTGRASHPEFQTDGAITGGAADMIAYGMPFLANPDLPERFRLGTILNSADPTTIYAHSAQGYTDYPFLEQTP